MNRKTTLLIQTKEYISHAPLWETETVEVGNLKDCCAETLFHMFYFNIARDGGDGGGVIVCKNYKETEKEFYSWYKKEYNREFMKWSDENVIFTDQEDFLSPGKYTYKVLEVIDMWDSEFKILPTGIK